MKRTELSTKLQRLITDVPYVTIASVCPDGTPWNTPVWGCFDDTLNLYWASWPKSQHSINIANNPQIFVVIYRSDAPEGEAVGLYLEMRARQLRTATAIEPARRVYTTNFGEDLSHEPFKGSCPRRLYKAAPIRVWVNDDDVYRSGFIDVRRQLA